jgi:hypothetical protein
MLCSYHMTQLCLSYLGLAVVFFHKNTTHLQWLNMIAAYFDFNFGLQVRYPDKILVILLRTFQINGDRTKQTSLKRNKNYSV